jgi:uncharacterized protein with beta-barrel porin domain
MHWMHEYLDTTPFVNAAFLGGTVGSFCSISADVDRDTGIFGISAAVPLLGSVYVFNACDLQVGVRSDAHTGSGGLAISW